MVSTRRIAVPAALSHALLWAALCLFFTGCLPAAPAAAASPSPAPTATPAPTPYVPETVVVRFVGDLMVSKAMTLSAEQPDGTYDFTPIFTDSIRKELSGADLMIGNLETPVAGKENGGFTGRPRFNAPDEYLDALGAAGFTVLTTANNHMLDRGVEGAVATAEKVRVKGFMQTGSFTSKEDAQQLLIADVRGVKVCVLAYTYHSTRTEEGKDKEALTWLRNYNEPEKMAADIEKARSQGADVVLVFTHMGTEGSYSENRLQRQMAKHLAASGADAAIFCHSHAVQPFDRIPAPDGREMFTAYSLGNFLADGEYRMSRSGMILELPVTFDREAGTVRVDNVRYVPSYSHQYTRGDDTTFRLYAAAAAMADDSLSGGTRSWAETAWNTVTGVAGDRFATPVKSFSDPVS